MHGRSVTSLQLENESGIGGIIIGIIVSFQIDSYC